MSQDEAQAAPSSSSSSSSSNQKRKVALITGITGQDGSYLAELLLQKGYEVHGMVRRASTFNTGRITHLCENPDTYQASTPVKLHYGDLADGSSLVRVLQAVKPDEIYNLGAQSHLKVSFDMCVYTGDVDGIGVLRLLEAIRTCDMTKTVRFYQASSSELYGKLTEVPQRETTPFCPRSPYGVAKLYAYWIIVNYREAYDIFAVNGILFNHESPRRGETFVTRKISRGVAMIHLGLQEDLELGNLNATRDWGHARDYVEAMWRMLQADKPEDYVISTGEGHTVREFVEAAFKIVGTEIKWEGSAENEIGRDAATGRVLVRVNALYYRPTEIEYPLGDSTKAKTKLDWQPQHTFDALVREMVEFDLAELKARQKSQAADRSSS